MAPTTPTVRLLVVDQSPVSREKLRLLFDAQSGIEVVGESATAQKALRLLDELSPTAALVDCDLPAPGSFSLVREMMSLFRVPIVMLTKRGSAELQALQAKAREAGAVALVSLASMGPGAEKSSRDSLIRTVRAMSEVKVVRRRGQRAEPERADPRATANPVSPAGPSVPSPVMMPTEREFVGDIDLVAVGASTGGPQVLETILRGLAKRLTVPVLIVQHLSQGFQDNLITWLSEATGTHICVGAHGMPVAPGVVYLAPDNKHMEVNASGCLVLNSDPPENGSRPSVSVLFRSVAEAYGPRAIGILLTGMGRDGAKELRLMRDRGALTIAQDEETSTVHGMPGEAIKLKGARYVLAPKRIVSMVEHHLPPAGQRRETVPCL